LTKKKSSKVIEEKICNVSGRKKGEIGKATKSAIRFADIAGTVVGFI
jgi:hypothetical protein